MAKFRRQHGKEGRGSGVFSGRLLSVFLIMAVMVIGTIYMAKSDVFSEDTSGTDLPSYETPEDRYFIPTSKNGQVVHHKYYSLSYDESAEQAEWVAYYLTKSSLQKANVPRAKRFNVDPNIPSRSAAHSDYIRSGYDRGHLVPAADMAFNKQAMQETFFMSNISPQVKQFNGAVWRELEECVRDWAYKFEGVYVVTGPIFGDSQKRIGKAKVLVPVAFYKVILDLESSKKKAIAFRLENKVSYDPLADHAVTIDDIEAETGLDFFDQLLEDDIEERLESNYNINQWPISKKRFDLRNTKWNRIK